MNNNDTLAGWRYHDGTKHPYGALMDLHHRYDPAANPLPLKKYLDLETIHLPSGLPPGETPALAALVGSPDDHDLTGQLDLATLTRLLHYSAGITKVIHYPQREIPFRAAACTGALYHIEMYVVCGDLPGLDAGVYHYAPDTNALDVLRKGDYRTSLLEVVAGEETINQAPVTLIYSDVFWRNAVKYQAREYRHAYWDCGTMLANTLAIATAYNLPARVVLGFVDTLVNNLLGLDASKEAALALLPVGGGHPVLPDHKADVAQLNLATMPVSRYEIDFPAIRQMHQASSLEETAMVNPWRASPYSPNPAEVSTDLVRLEPLSGPEQPSDPLETVIIRRGSSRHFARQPISFKQLSSVLASTTRGFSTDLFPSAGESLTQPYLIVQAVDGLASGTYVYHPSQRGLEPLKEGDFRDVAGQLGLGQALPADASVNIYFLTDLDQVFEAYGNRGYRAAQLVASITAGKMYLAAYAMGFGATGLTFYDDEVTAFFSPHAKGKSVMFLIALGIPVRRSQIA